MPTICLDWIELVGTLRFAYGTAARPGRDHAIPRNQRVPAGRTESAPAGSDAHLTAVTLLSKIVKKLLDKDQAHGD